MQSPPGLHRYSAMQKLLFLTLLAIPFASALAQSATDKTEARQLKQEAVRLMDNGDPDKAITMLASAQKLDPDDHTYQYEMGYAWLLKKEYPKAIDAFCSTTRYPDVTDQCYQMLGDAYDMNGQRSKARGAYADGLKRFPSSGRLYMESGLIDLAEDNYTRAIASWEQGIKVQPDYASNYYRLATLFARTTDRIWAIFYGELFMNIERNTERTREISRLLFSVYKRSITFSGDSTRLDMANNTLYINNKKELKLPFWMVYTGVFMVCLPSPGSAKEVTIGLVSNTRARLVSTWFDKQHHDKEYPNLLLDFHRTLEEKGILEAYNYWLLMKGNEDEFSQWRDTHPGKLEAFAAWFRDNPLQLDTSHFFVRTQYD
jgi:tetratricopeptide (TPR) repeat protein